MFSFYNLAFYLIWLLFSINQLIFLPLVLRMDILLKRFYSREFADKLGKKEDSYKIGLNWP